MPITEQVHKILFEGTAPRESIAALMQRDPKPETSLPSRPRA
jgi:glycerol-3-phosphate dehydrogenase